jgi:hypothetical protein
MIFSSKEFNDDMPPKRPRAIKYWLLIAIVALALMLGVAGWLLRLLRFVAMH